MRLLEAFRGLLPWRGFLMIDAIVVAMVFVLPALAWSVFAVKSQRRYQRHKQLQLALSAALLALLLLFEIDIQYIDNWRLRAAPSPFYDSAAERGLVIDALRVHLGFATTTLALWIGLVVRALQRFPTPPRPNDHSRDHARWGWVAVIDLALTAVSGWTFYYLAFVA